jgi:hypothetical protein
MRINRALDILIIRKEAVKVKDNYCNIQVKRTKK